MLDALSMRRLDAIVEIIAAAQRRSAFATITGAFADDPPCRWLWSDDDEYQEYFPSFAAAFGGAAIDFGTAIATENLAGVALWMAPGVGPDEQALALFIEHSTAASRRDTVFKLFGEMGRVHPSEPHWYLPLIGVAPNRQGRGLGGRLLASVLARCDADGLPAYLEASSSRCIPLYRRYGFEPIGEIAVGGCPTIVPMYRRTSVSGK